MICRFPHSGRCRGTILSTPWAKKTLVAQCRAGAGGTWDGTTENLRRGWSPVFVHDDGSEGAQALIARGAVPVRTLSGLDDLQPAQLQF